MIVKLLKRDSALTQISKRQSLNFYQPLFSMENTTRDPLKVEFRKVLLILPILFISGVCTGIAIMLAVSS